METKDQPTPQPQKTETENNSTQKTQSQKAQDTVTKDMNIGQVVALYPNAAQVMTEYGLHCVGCHINPYESIEMGARGHGMSDETIEKMLADVNKTIANGSSASSLKQVTAPRDRITVSEAAATKLAEVLKQQGKTGWGLKLSVLPGGCAGNSYQMALAEKPGSDDIVIEAGDARVFIDPLSEEKIAGAEIDYVESLQGAGFKVNNPNAKSTCGCGESFS